ncbi:cytochrome C oxidase subunit IV family protein [candidate division KSB1 bacterium]|nr:cytochrome C oxidase subunit IV family protein [candidate division KSB1 bacterium]
MSQQSPETTHASYGTYVLIWFCLIVLTGLTVTVAGTNFGHFSVWMAIIIASVKTLLVLFIFMNLNYEPRLFRNMVLVVVITLTIFIVFTFFDVSYR